MGDGRSSEWESSTAVGETVAGSWGILDVDNIEGREGGKGVNRREKDKRRMGK